MNKPIETVIAGLGRAGWDIRDGAPLLITPKSVRETIAVLETCRRQNPHIWAGVE